MNGSGPDGNHHPDMSPHGCYPCCGRRLDRVAVADDAERRALREALGAGALADLTRPHDAGTLAQRLRECGRPREQERNLARHHRR